MLFGMVLLLGILGFFIFNPTNKPFETLFLSSIVIIVGFWPLYRLIGTRKPDAIPVLVVNAAFNTISYGMAGLFDQSQDFKLIGFLSDDEQQFALLTVIVSLLFLYIGYFIIGQNFYGNKKRWQWSFQVRPTGYLVLLVLYPFVVLIFNISISAEIKEVVQIISVLVDYIFYLLIYGVYTRKIVGIYKYIILCIIIPYKISISLVSGILAGVFNILVSIGIAYYAASKRIPYLMIIIAFGLIFLLQPVKREYRDNFGWNIQSTISPLEKMQVFVSLGWSYYFSADKAEGQVSEGASRSFNRLNNLTVTAAIIADTPKNQPFLYGDTYIPLFTKWIPRFIWPDKPLEDIGNRWARRYGYLNADDFGTSYNLPWLPEMYMNFGIIGVIAMNLLIGIFLRFLSLNFWKNPRNPSEFAFGMVLGMPLMFVESNFSLMFGALFISIITLVSICYVSAKLDYKHFVWQRKRYNN